MLSFKKLNALSQLAINSKIGRKHLNLHTSYTDPCQRFFNAISAQSYIRPHRHSIDPYFETLIAIRGLLGLIIFDNQGIPKRVNIFGTESYEKIKGLSVGVEIPPDEWHMVVSLVPQSIIFEVKTGPFDPARAKEFAPWSPPEEMHAAVSFLKQMRQLATKSISLKKLIPNVNHHE